MALGIIGKKIAMTRIFDEKGSIIPVTVVLAGPCPILQIKRAATDGYAALQLGFENKHESKANKPMLGHFKKSGAAPVRMVREFRLDEVDQYEVGKAVDVSIFEAGEKVDLIGVSKGRGWSGVIKRFHTTRGPETHGSMYHRRPGSMGASSDPSHVWKGKKLPGQLGNSRVTAQNVMVVRVDKERNLLLIRGAVPGHTNAFVMIAKGKKAAKKAAKAAKRGK